MFQQPFCTHAVVVQRGVHSGSAFSLHHAHRTDDTVRIPYDSLALALPCPSRTDGRPRTINHQLLVRHPQPTPLDRLQHDNDLPNPRSVETPTRSGPSICSPNPNPSSTFFPETPAQLHEFLRDYFAIKANAALATTLPVGSDILRMRSAAPSASPIYTQPHFLANFITDTETVLPHPDPHTGKYPAQLQEALQQRGRVLSVMKCYEQWNSGMRHASPPQQVRYLSGLSDLHRSMREHGCRYGFIISETEVVCVRYGGGYHKRCMSHAIVKAGYETELGCDCADQMPNFGALELTDPVPLAACSQAGSTSSPNPNLDPSLATSGSASISSPPMTTTLTAALALFCLHFLSRDLPPE